MALQIDLTRWSHKMIVFNNRFKIIKNQNILFKCEVFFLYFINIFERCYYMSNDGYIKFIKSL